MNLFRSEAYKALVSLAMHPQRCVAHHNPKNKRIMRTYTFKTTVEQKALIQKLVEAIDDCRKAGIQMFTTDGANELLCYNTTDFDLGPDSIDNLEGCWEKKNGRFQFTRADEAVLAEWLQIPIADCDVIDGNELNVDFVSWGCCGGGFYAHKKS